MGRFAEILKNVSGFNPELRKNSYPTVEEHSDITVVDTYDHATAQIIIDNTVETTIVTPYPKIQAEIPYLKITKQLTHHGLSSLEERMAALASSGALVLVTKLAQKVIGNENKANWPIEPNDDQAIQEHSRLLTRRSFLSLCTKLSFLGFSAVSLNALFGKKNIIGRLANIGAQQVGYAELKAAMAHFDPLRSFIGGILQPQERQKTFDYSPESIAIDFETGKTLHSEAQYILTSFPINWNETQKTTHSDELFIFEPKNSSFQLQLHSSLAHQHQGKDVMGYQVGVLLKKLLEIRNKSAEFFSHNRYNDPMLGFPAQSADTVLTDPEGIVYPINYMHSGPLFLTFNSPDQTPLFATVPSWASQPSMSWGGCVTSETPINLIEYIVFANEYACWSTDMLPKYQVLNQDQKSVFLKLFIAKLSSEWTNVPAESLDDPAYHMSIVFNTNGKIEIIHNADLSNRLQELSANNTLEEFLAQNNIVRPVSLVDLNRTEPIPDRESNAKYIAINFAIIKDNQCIAHITANQIRRVNMNQLHKIAQLYLQNRGIDTENAFLMGMDEHGGGEVVNLVNIIDN